MAWDSQIESLKIGRPIRDTSFWGDYLKVRVCIYMNMQNVLSDWICQGNSGKELEIQLQVHKILFSEDQNGNSIKMTGK